MLVQTTVKPQKHDGAEVDEPTSTVARRLFVIVCRARSSAPNVLQLAVMYSAACIVVLLLMLCSLLTTGVARRSCDRDASCLADAAVAADVDQAAAFKLDDASTLTSRHQVLTPIEGTVSRVWPQEIDTSSSP